jgi:hypothetical protein
VTRDHGQEGADWASHPGVWRAAPTFPVIEPCNSMTRLVAGLPKSCKRRTRPGLRIAAFDEVIHLASLLLGVPWPESSTLSILEGRLEIATQS